MKAKLDRRRFLQTLGAGAAGAAAPRWLSAAAQADKADTTATASKPNFIVIYADDQGYGDLSCYGATKLKTPNLDRMADEGMKFTDFYVSAPVCSPTRSSLMTGCYPRRVGMHRHVPRRRLSCSSSPRSRAL